MKEAIAALRDEAFLIESRAEEIPPKMGGDSARARAELLRLVAECLDALTKYNEAEAAFGACKSEKTSDLLPLANDINSAAASVAAARAAVAAWKEGR